MALRNITLSAEEDLIRRARQRATEGRTSLNLAFREWLARFAAGDSAADTYETLMRQLDGVRTDRRFRRRD